MNQFLNRLTVNTAIGGAVFLLFLFTCYLVGVRVNTSKSIPIGLYWTSRKPIEKGAYVLFCPPQVALLNEAKKRGYIGAGFCPGEYGYMMKRILAAKNDEVSIADEGVRVNGELLPFSRPIKADKSGRPLTLFRKDNFTLDASEVLLMTDVSITSFDARYFGPVKLSQIKTVIIPVITW